MQCDSHPNVVVAQRRAGVNGVVNLDGSCHNAPLSPRVALRYRYPEERRMALIIKDIAIVAGLGLFYLMMVIVMIVIAIVARE